MKDHEEKIVERMKFNEALEQGIPDLARAMKTYYDALIGLGFSNEQAMELVLGYQNTMLMAPGGRRP